MEARTMKAIDSMTEKEVWQKIRVTEAELSEEIDNLKSMFANKGKYADEESAMKRTLEEIDNWTTVLRYALSKVGDAYKPLYTEA